MTIDAPGIYDISAAEYHADPCPDPSLSSSIAKVICLQSPAHAWRQHPRLNPVAVHEDTEHFDLGTVAHALLLEGTANIVAIDAKDWRTTAAKDARDAARAEGKTPMLAKVWADVEAMVGSARLQLEDYRDPDVRAMFTGGAAEQTLIWQEDGGTWCRARLDYLRRRFAIDDYKTATCANPDQWTRKLFDYGYDLQVAWYARGLEVLKGIEPTFRFAVQETTPPYALSVVALGEAARVIGEKKRRYALEVWQACRRHNDWPGYPRQICYADLPAWQEAWWLSVEERT